MYNIYKWNSYVEHVQDVLCTCKKNVEMNRYAQNRNILKPNNLFLRVWANFGIMRK